MNKNVNIDKNKQKEAIIFGLQNNTQDNMVIMIIKDPADEAAAMDPEYIDFYLNLYLEANGYIEYRSAFEFKDGRIVIFVGNDEEDLRELWDITDEAIFKYGKRDEFEKIFNQSLDELKERVFVINKTEDGEYELVNKFTEEIIEPIGQDYEGCEEDEDCE